MQWKSNFIFKGKQLPYNRIQFNNPSERAVEVLIRLDFLASLRRRNSILEVGNVLAHYENSLSEYVGIRPRRIIDKFEVDLGVEQLDLMNLPSEEKYDVIISISTVEHIGQGIDPSGLYGESTSKRDLEAPLKAIAKIYDLVSFGGKALITVPFGKLIDAKWFIQFNEEYLKLLETKYGIPEDSISTSFFKKVEMELNSNNPHQLWVEAEESQLIDTEYNWPFTYANGIGVIELTKNTKDFFLKIDLPLTALLYNSLCTTPISPKVNSQYNCVKDISLLVFPDWSQTEESLCLDLQQVIRAIATHPARSQMTLLINNGKIPDTDAALILSSVTMNLLMNEDLDITDALKIFLVGQLDEIQWEALLPNIHARIILENEDREEIARVKAENIPFHELNSFIVQA